MYILIKKSLAIDFTIQCTFIVAIYTSMRYTVTLYGWRMLCTWYNIIYSRYVVQCMTYNAWRIVCNMYSECSILYNEHRMLFGIYIYIYCMLFTIPRTYDIRHTTYSIRYTISILSILPLAYDIVYTYTRYIYNSLFNIVLRLYVNVCKCIYI